MSNTYSRAMVLFAIVLFLVDPSFLQAQLPRLDDPYRIVTLGVLPTPSFPRDSIQNQLNNSIEWKDFLSNAKGNHRAIWNEKKGTPSSIGGDTIHVGVKVNYSNIEEVAKEFLLKHQYLLNIKPGEISITSAFNYNGLWHAQFQQVYKGIPVWNGYAFVTLNSADQIVNSGSEFYPDILVSTSPRVELSSAIKSTKTHLDFNASTDSLINTRLIIIPIENQSGFSYQLAWQLDVSTQNPLGNWLVFVDANTGDFLLVENTIISGLGGTVRGVIHPKYPSDSPVTVTFKNIYIDLWNYLGQYVGQRTTNTNGDYYYNIAYSYYRLRSSLRGPWVDTQIGTEVGTSPEALHELWVTPSTHNWTWSGSNIVFNDEPNVYYYVNEMHDWISGSPFYFGGLNYQMRAVVRNSADPLNAYYNPSTGNILFGVGGILTVPPGNGIYVGTWTLSNFSLNTDIIRHEYGHGIIDKIYEAHNDNLGFFGQQGATNEGLADYFAATRENDATIGEGLVTGTDPWERHLDSPDLKIPNNWDGSGVPDDIHWNGQIISGAVWDSRITLGTSIVDPLVYDAFHLLPKTFNQFLDKMIIADDNRFGDGNTSNGTPHYDQLVQAFSLHGITTSIPPPPQPPPAAPVLSWYIYEGSPVNLSWTGGTEEYFDHFYLYRSLGSDITTTSHGYQDRSVIVRSSGYYTATYKVKAVDIYDQSSAWSNVKSTKVDLAKMLADGSMIQVVPESYGLSGNYPNPFNPVTTIRYDLPEASRVNLAVYDLTGREVMSWQQQEQPGFKQVVWNGTDRSGRPVPTGVYIYRLVAISTESDQRFTESRKMVLMK